jgi:sugar phosphate isomerase/epimerase
LFVAAAVGAAGVGTGRLAGAGTTLTVGCRDAMLKTLGFPDSWSAARAVGAEAIELLVDEEFGLPSLKGRSGLYSLATEAEVRRLSGDMKASGLGNFAFCVASRFDERPDFECEFGSRLARIAQQLGVKAIRIDVASRTRPPAEFLGPAVTALDKLIAATEGTGVCFGVENHSRITNDPAFLTSLLDRVGSKRLGVTLDVGNFYWFGNPLAKVYEIIEPFAPRVVHTHCKSIRYPAAQREVRREMGWEYQRYCAPIDRGDIDYARVVKILRRAGYAGGLCVENEGLGSLPEADRVNVLAAEIQYLKRVRAGRER